MITYKIYSRSLVLVSVALVALSALIFVFNMFDPAYAAVSTTHIVSEGESIQAAIDGAAVGDTVFVQAGSYTESLVLDKAVHLTGVNSRTTILNGPLNQRVISVAAGLDTGTVISGFTIQRGGRGAAPAYGGGIHLNSSPLLSHLIITGNIASQYGGGVFADADFHLQHSLVLANESSFEGAFLFALQDAHITRTQILTQNQSICLCFAMSVSGDAYINEVEVRYGATGNLGVMGNTYLVNSVVGQGSFGVTSDVGDIHVVSSTIEHNFEGGGVETFYGSVYVTNSMIAHNTSIGFGAGIYAGAAVHVYSSTIIGNSSSEEGGGIYAVDEVHIQNSLAQDNRAPFVLFAYAKKDLYITNTQVLTHEYDYSGIVMYTEGNGFVKNSQISHADGDGLFALGSIFVEGSSINNGKAALFSYDGDIHIDSSYLTYNSVGAYTDGSIFITDTTVAHNTIAGGVSAGGDVSAYSSTIIFNHSVENSGGSIMPEQGNGYGGGIYVGGDAHIQNSLVNSNTAQNDGGGIYISGTAYISNTSIAHNRARSGGGISASQGVVYLTDCQLNDNQALIDGGAVWPDGVGGGAFIGVAEINNCMIDGNTAEGLVAGLMINFALTMTDSIVQNHIHQTGLFELGTVTFPSGFISNTIISNNQDFGAAVMVYFYDESPAGHVVIQDSTFSDNDTAYGSLFVYGDNLGSFTNQVLIRDTEIISNSSSHYGTGLTFAREDMKAAVQIDVENVLIENHNDNQSTPAIFAGLVDLTLNHLTIASRPLAATPAISVRVGTQITLLNSIVSSYSHGIDTIAYNFEVFDEEDIEADYNLFSMPEPFSGTMIVGGEHNITGTNPLFAGPQDYRLAAGSPAIDAAMSSDVSTDILGNPRPGSGSSLSDIGAYECDASPQLTDFSAMLGGGSVQWNWSGGNEYRLWTAGNPYQTTSGDGQLLTNPSFTDSVNGMTAYFYTLSSLSNCGVTAEEPVQLGVFPFALTTE